MTDCLNFGNPERPEIMEQFARAVDGLAAACSALEVPIVSGNVSLYNETTTATGERRAILPTPTVAAVGLLRSQNDIVTQWFKQAGDIVILLGAATSTHSNGLAGSEYAVRQGKSRAGALPKIDLHAEVRLQKLVLELARSHLLQSAHDVSDGGLAVALAESCTTAPEAKQNVGARIDLDAPADDAAKLALLFGEAPSRVVITVTPSSLQAVLAVANRAQVPARELGVTGGRSLSIAMIGGPPPAGGDVDAHAAHAGEVLAIWQWKLDELRYAREACLDAIVGR